MNNTDTTRQKIELALDIGADMLRAGAEINRVEESVYRICMAFGATRVEVYAMNYLVLVTAYTADDEVITESRRIWRFERDLTKLIELNDLSRSICGGGIAYEDIRPKLIEIENIGGLSLMHVMLLYALVSGSFTIFFGGGALDMIVSIIIGILVAPVDRLLSNMQMNQFVRVGLCSAFCGLIAALTYRAGLDVSADMIGIGNIMIFIPGVLFTIAVQEILSNNMLTGLGKIVEAIIISLVIATGFVLVTTQLL